MYIYTPLYDHFCCSSLTFSIYIYYMYRYPMISHVTGDFLPFEDSNLISQIRIPMFIMFSLSARILQPSDLQGWTARGCPWTSVVLRSGSGGCGKQRLSLVVVVKKNGAWEWLSGTFPTYPIMRRVFNFSKWGGSLKWGIHFRCWLGVPPF